MKEIIECGNSNLAVKSQFENGGYKRVWLFAKCYYAHLDILREAQHEQMYIALHKSTSEPND